MKKVISVILAMVLILAMAGCAPQESKANQTGGEVPILTWLVPGDKQSDISSVMDELNKILETKIGAKLDLQFIDSGAYTEKMTMHMASGFAYDLCFTGYVNNYQNAVKRGGLMQLDELLKSTPDLVEALPDYVWNVAKIKGNIYAVPNQQIMAQTLALYIKKDLADKYGLDPASIKETTDIEPFLEKVKNGEPNIYPFRSSYGTNSFNSVEKERTSEEIISGISVSKTGDQYVVSSTYAAEEYLEKAKLLNEWYKKGYIRADVASVMDDTQDQKAGKYAVYVANYAPGAAEDASKKWGWDVIAIPISKPFISMNSGREAMTGIGKKSAHPELAVKLLELVNTDEEVFNLISYGIEGKHYTKLEDGSITYIESSGYAPKASWTFGNTFNGYILEGQEPDLHAQTKALNDSATRSNLSGFVLDTTDIRTEISQLETVRGEYKVVNNGSMAPDTYFDKFLSELDESGINTIIEAAQSQVDEFTKDN